MDNENKNVTLFIGSLRGGGAERVCVTIANKLIENNYRVDLLLLNLSGAKYHKHLDSEDNITCLGVRHARYAMFRLLRYLRNKRPETIIVFNHQLAVLLIIARMILRRNYRIIARNITILSFSNRYSWNIWHKYIVKFVVKRLYHRVDKIIAQGQGMKHDLINNYKVDDNKVVVINNPVAPKIERLSARDWGNDKKRNEILYVGRLERIKGLNNLIKAFHIAHKLNGSLMLRIIGDGTLKNELINETKKMELMNNVIFHGYEESVEKYYLQAKATVLTSLYEGFPNVLIESIMLGTPVIAFDCPCGPREIIRNGVNGILVRNQDVQELAGAFVRVINMDIPKEVIIKTAEPYRSNVIIKQYINLINETSN